MTVQKRSKHLEHKVKEICSSIKWDLVDIYASFDLQTIGNGFLPIENLGKK